ncbi:MAG: PepSY domain-containing protein [Bacteriovoracia bacterium]
MFWPVIFTLISLPAFADVDALKLVPGGKIKSKTSFEIKVTTAQNTEVELGIDQDGDLEEASGLSAEKGDVFEPGEKRLPLKDVVAALKKAGKTLQGEWIFEQSDDGDWLYDLEGIENKKNVDYIVNAENGKLLRTEVDE